MKQDKSYLPFIAIILVVFIVGILYENGYLTGLFQKTNSTVQTSDKGQDKSLPDNNNKTEEKELNLALTVLKVSEITEEMKGKKVKIKAKILERTDNKDKHIFLTVSDETGKISMPIFADKNIDNQQLLIDKSYIFAGIVNVFNNKIEIVPQSQQDIIEIQKQQIEINKQNIGKVVTLEGSVITKYMHPEGHIFLSIKIMGNDSDIEVPLFKKLNYNADKLSIQSVITVKGKITEYKGKLQVIPEKSEDVNIISKGDENKVQFKNIKDITNNDRGKMLTTNAYITGVRNINGHTYFSLTDVNDENKRIDAVLFRAETKELSARKTVIDNASKDKFQVWVLAMVDIYDGKLELIIDKIDTN